MAGRRPGSTGELEKPPTTVEELRGRKLELFGRRWVVESAGKFSGYEIVHLEVAEIATLLSDRPSRKYLYYYPNRDKIEGLHGGELRPIAPEEGGYRWL